ncbi:MAG: hypothetical protein H0X45_11615 [Planctomycetes bacterium]|nr:hypothetical protein [Planctomycetota bacterium]
MIPHIRFALPLAFIACVHGAVEVPAEHRLEMKQLVWTQGGTFVEGASNKNRPEAIGRIEESQIVWNKTVYPIDSFAEKEGVITVVFELGTLTVKRRDPKRAEGRFADKAGATHIFRTGGGW